MYVGMKFIWQETELTVLRVISKEKITWRPQSGNTQTFYVWTVDTEDGIKRVDDRFL